VHASFSCTDDIFNGSELSIKSATADSVEVLLDLNLGVECAINNSPGASIQVCISQSPTLQLSTCKPFTTTTTMITFDGLQANTSYTIQAIITVGSQNVTHSINTTTSSVDRQATNTDAPNTSQPSTNATGKNFILANILALYVHIYTVYIHV